MRVDGVDPLTPIPIHHASQPVGCAGESARLLDTQGSVSDRLLVGSYACRNNHSAVQFRH